MKYIFILTINFLLLNVSKAYAQIIERCDESMRDTFNCNNVKLTLHTRVGTDKIARRGIVFKDSFLPCDVCRLNETLIFKFGNGHSLGARMDVDCTTSEQNKLFNGKFHHQKDGIWFMKNKLGNIESATFYELGEKLKVITFWPNGQPKQLVLYSNGKRRLSGGRFYDEKALPKVVLPVGRL